jgi:osmoprotectant transport system permease protein
VTDLAEASVAATPGAAASGPGARRARDRSWIVLVATPVVLGLLAALLWWYVAGADKDVQEASALRWDVRLYPQIRRHIDLTLWSTLWVLLIAIPLGVALTRPRLRRFGAPLLAVANSGQAIPAYGLFVLLMTWQGSGPRTAIIALTVYTLLPVLRNTMVGLDQVDPSVIEAGRGMGMTRIQALLRIELPLAVPVILAGIRTALVINVGMATLAFIIGGGGLGVTIFSGIQLSRDLVLFTGAAITALLALTVDWVAAVVERILRPRGL